MGIALFFVGLYYFIPQHREGIKFIGWAMTVGIAVYTAFHAAKTFDYNIARKKEESAYAFIALFNQDDTVDIRAVLEPEVGPDAEARQYDRIKADKNLRKQVILILGVFEDIAIAISTGYADESVLYRSISGMVPLYFEGLKGYINGLRKEADDPSLYRELEQLNDRWKNRP